MRASQHTLARCAQQLLLLRTCASERLPPDHAARLPLLRAYCMLQPLPPAAGSWGRGSTALQGLHRARTQRAAGVRVGLLQQAWCREGSTVLS